MSSTNLQIISDAFQKAGVVDETQSPTNAQAANGLRILNGYLLTQARDGMRLGWYNQTNLASTAPLNDADIYDVTLMLTRQLAGAYGIALDDPVLIDDIASAEIRLTKRSILTVQSDLSELSRSQAGPWGGVGFF